MGFVKAGASAIGRLLIIASLAGTFAVGMIGVFYLSLTGEEIKIPKIVGKNFNAGQDELVSNGLRIKKIATRYSEEKPNTILEQRPRAGTPAKTGLIISVVVSKENPDATEAPADVKEDDDDAADDIEELPELKTDKPKKRARKRKKPSSKTRDVIEDKSKTEAKDKDSASKKTIKDNKKPGGDKKPTSTNQKKGGTDKSKTPKSTKPKPKTNKKSTNNKKPKTGINTRSRRVKKSN